MGAAIRARGAGDDAGRRPRGLRGRRRAGGSGRSGGQGRGRRLPLRGRCRAPVRRAARCRRSRRPAPVRGPAARPRLPRRRPGPPDPPPSGERKRRRDEERGGGQPRGSAGIVTLANGSVAARRTIPIRKPSTSAPGRPRIDARTPGAPSVASAPPARARAPVAMASGTSGTTARFVIGESGATRPKASRTRGSVAACAASETPRPSRTQRGSQPARRSRAAVIGADQAMRPAVAAAESWSPTSTALAGLATTSRATAQPSAAAAVPGRPDSRARSATPGHRGGPHHRRRRARQHRVDGDRDHDRARSSAPGAARQDGPDQPGDEGDVPARDRDHVREAGRRERRREIAVDPVAEPDEDPGGQSGRRLGECAGERIARGSPGPLQQPGRVAGVRHELQGARAQRAGDPGAPQEVPVAALWWRRRPSPLTRTRSPGSTAG